MTRKMRVKPQASNLMLIFASCILAAGTLYFVSCLNYLPYSPARDWITDALAMPGGIVGWIVLSGRSSRWSCVALAEGSRHCE